MSDFMMERGSLGSAGNGGLYSGGGEGEPAYAVFSAQCLPHIGGIEKFTDSLARELGSRGARVSVVTNALKGDAGVEKLTSNVNVYRLPCFPLINGRLPVPWRNAQFEEIWDEMASARYNGVLINARFYPHTFLGLRLAASQGVRPVVMDHGSAYLTFGSKLLDPIVALYERIVTYFVKKRNPVFYGVSAKSVQWLRNFGIEGEGILSNSIDAKCYREGASPRDFRCEFEVDPCDLIVAYTGRLIPEKGIMQLMEAARELKERDVPVAFFLAGDGPLREKAESLNPGNVVFLGRTAPEDVAALMLQADLLCMLTRSEGFSTTLLEASACGTPALITDVGGVDDLIPSKEFGTVLEDDSAQTAVRHITYLEQHRDVLASQGEKVRRRTEELFSWKKTADDFVRACDVANNRVCVDERRR